MCLEQVIALHGVVDPAESQAGKQKLSAGSMSNCDDPKPPAKQPFNFFGDNSDYEDNGCGSQAESSKVTITDIITFHSYLLLPAECSSKATTTKR